MKFRKKIKHFVNDLKEDAIYAYNSLKGYKFTSNKLINDLREDFFLNSDKYFELGKQIKLVDVFKNTPIIVTTKKGFKQLKQISNERSEHGNKNK